MSIATTSEPRSNAPTSYVNDWANDLCDCCTDSNICFCVFCCSPFYNCYLHQKAGECCCTPVFCSSSLFQLRTKIRADNKIKGSIWKDAALVYCCTLCAMCQMANELKYQGVWN